jgi:hypothetical protein
MRHTTKNLKNRRRLQQIEKKLRRAKKEAKRASKAAA